MRRMTDQDLYSGLIRLHILHHAAEGPLFGLGMIRELQRHGYRIGPGTLYPLLHRLEERRYLVSAPRVVAGRTRRSYVITRSGRRALARAKARVRELFDELFEESGRA
jgi:DNA-binding PadR family transcriptional regulator